MIDYICMGVLVLLLAVFVLYKAEYMSQGNNNFFDINTSKAMRGLWCIIVVLVHVPVAYQNRIQDMLGSFAYIGVTFFFMTSAYGLVIGAKKKVDITKSFWKRRLPKLIVPNWITNIVFCTIFIILGNKDYSLIDFISINNWVEWLLVCYIVFWAMCRIFKNHRKSNIVTVTMILIFSICVYWLKIDGVIKVTTWHTEVIGFILGIALASNYKEIHKFLVKNWYLKAGIFGGISLTLGVLYLKFKHVVFFGDYLLKILLGMAILSFILVLNSKIKIGNRMISYLGEISFEVYLIHAYSFKLISQIYPSCTSGIFILVSIVTTILFATGIHVLCKLILQKRRGSYDCE